MASPPTSDPAGTRTIVPEAEGRRRHPRNNQPASVRVRIFTTDSPVEFPAVLVNSSAGGLAIRHWRKDLEPGSQAMVSWAGQEETLVRVKWNWISGPLVISGLERRLADALHTPAVIQADNFSVPIRKKSQLVGVAGLTALLIIAGWYFRTKLF